MCWLYVVFINFSICRYVCFYFDLCIKYDCLLILFVINEGSCFFLCNFFGNGDLKLFYERIYNFFMLNMKK